MVIPLGSPVKPPLRRYRRKSDEMYENWGKTEGKHKVIYRQDSSSSLNSKGKYRPRSSFLPLFLASALHLFLASALLVSILFYGAALCACKDSC